MKQQPKITWDKGSAYDLFVSLLILHRPDEFGLRPSWAAGVRSRLPMHLRDVLEQSQKFINVPLSWIFNLPEPKDSDAVIAALQALHPEDILPALVFSSKQDEETLDYQQFLLSLDGKQRLKAQTEKRIKNHYRPPRQFSKEMPRAIFDAWSHRREFGEKFLEGLNAYVNSFYHEEEVRIIPAQTKALEQARNLAAEKDVLALLEELSAGVRMDWVKKSSQLVLAPSFWGAPFVFFGALDEKTGIILFGARPKGMSMVPGELVPDELLHGLKALANPTRLRILRYLLEGPCSPGELSKILRLRPPTMVHHLHNLRLAGLVLVTVSPEAERRYALRKDGIDATIQNLQRFLSVDESN